MLLFFKDKDRHSLDQIINNNNSQFNNNNKTMQENDLLVKPSIESSTLINSLQNLNNRIAQNISKMEDLKEVFQEAQQKKFLSTFLNIMDKMSTDLQNANDAYQKIDRQIAQHPQCSILSKELHYFQNQCIQLKRTLSKRQDILTFQKTREIQLKKQQQYLKKQLYEQTYKQMKYTAKMQRESNKSKTAFQGMSKEKSHQRSGSVKMRNTSTGRETESMHGEIYRKRPRSLRHMTSLKAEDRKNITMHLPNKKSANLFTTFKEV